MNGVVVDEVPPIVEVALAYDNSLMGDTSIIIIGQALYFGDQVNHILMNPNQIRMNGGVVDEVPRHLSQGLPSTHSIYCSEEIYRIPLNLKGCISYFNVRKPTLYEIKNCTHLVMTSDVEWDPHSSIFDEQEQAVNVMEENYAPPERSLFKIVTGSIIKKIRACCKDCIKKSVRR